MSLLLLFARRRPVVLFNPSVTIVGPGTIRPKVSVNRNP